MLALGSFWATKRRFSLTTLCATATSSTSASTSDAADHLRLRRALGHSPSGPPARAAVHPGTRVLAERREAKRSARRDPPRSLARAHFRRPRRRQRCGAGKPALH